jgi:hypothetical protein
LAACRIDFAKWLDGIFALYYNTCNDVMCQCRNNAS